MLSSVKRVVRLGVSGCNRPEDQEICSSAHGQKTVDLLPIYRMPRVPSEPKVSAQRKRTRESYSSAAVILVGLGAKRRKATAFFGLSPCCLMSKMLGMPVDCR